MKKLLSSLILLSAFTTTVSGVDFVDWDVNGHLYAVVGETPDLVMSWDDAQATADDLGGYLVTLGSAAELNFVRNSFGGTELFWTGMTSTSGQNQFQWQNGEPVTYSYFGSTSPDPSIESSVIINQIGSRGFTRGYFGAVTPDSQYRAIIEFDGDVPPANVPDGGNPLVLIAISAAAGMICRFLKR